MASRKLQVEIIGDASSLNKAFGKASDSTSKFGSTLKTLGKVAAVGVGAAFAGLAATLKVGFDELADGQKVAAQTGAALKSTGKAANVTAKQIEGLATSLSEMSGVDDEAIQSGENLLLTFTNIRNEVGKGNDIFDQATKAALDLSVAFGKDMSSSAILVGKALNDPIKGLSALSRVGVSFTAQQKKTITSLVESGHVMEAQKLILAELTRETGGSAKAFGETLPGQLSKLRNAFEESAAKLAEALLPALTRLVQFATDAIPAIQAFVQNLIGIAQPYITAAIDQIGPAFERLRASASNALGILQDLFPAFQKIASTTFSAAMSSNGQSLIAATIAMYAFHRAAVAVTAAMEALAGASLATTLTSLITPVGLLTAGVGLLAFAFYRTKIASDDTTTSLDRQRAAVDALKGAADESAQSQQRLRDAHIAVKQAALDVTTALQRRNQLEKDGKKGTDEFTQAQIQVQRAYSNRKSAEVELAQASNAVTDAAKKQSGVLKGLSQEAKTARTEAAQLTAALSGAGKEAEKKSVVAAYAREMNNLAKQARTTAEETKKISPQISAAATAFAKQATAAANVAKKTGEIPAALRLVIGPSRSAGVDIGAALGSGVVAGIAGSSAGVRAAAANVVSQAEQAARARAQAKSPSELFAAVGRDIGAGMRKGITESYGRLAEAGKTAVDKVVDAAVAAVQARQGALGEAVGSLVSAALSAFDALHEGVKTKAEKALEAFDLRQAVAEQKKRIAELVAAAKAASGEVVAFQAQPQPQLTQKEGETDAEFLQRKLDAQKAYNDEYEGLIKAAADAQQALTDERNRQALEKQRAALERKAEESRKAEDNQTALERYRFDRRLGKLQTALNEHHITYAEFIKKVKKLLEDNEIPLRDRGTILGKAVAAGLRDALSDVQDAAAALAREIKTQLEKIHIVLHVTYVREQGAQNATGGNATHKASGGTFRRGQKLLVGERGPELVTFGSAGNVTPNNALGMGGGDTIVNINGPVYGADARQLAIQVRDELNRMGRWNGGGMLPKAV